MINKKECAGLVGWVFGHNFMVAKLKNDSFVQIDLNEMAWPDMQQLNAEIEANTIRLICRRCGKIKQWGKL